MDYGKLLTKAWTTIWNHKFLIGLGILASLGQGGGGGGGGGRGGSGSGPDQFPNFPSNAGPEFERFMNEGGPVILAVILGLVCVGLIIGIALWVLNRTAQGGMIDGVNTIETGGVSGFGAAFRAGWGKIGRMLLISLIAAIPSLILAIVVAAMVVAYISSNGAEVLSRALTRNDPERLMAALGANIGFVIGLVALACPLALASWALQAVATFADRACMLEGKGVMESYSRGWQVLRANLGPAVLLFLIQIGIGVALGLLLIGPSIAILLCCILWPVFLLIGGTIEAYFSTLWTLAWREWTGSTPTGEPSAPVPAPSV